MAATPTTVVVLCSLFGTAVSTDVLGLTGATFAKHLQDNKQTLIEFYAPWCGHCKKLEPEFEKAANLLKDKNVRLGKVDATEEKDLATKYSVKGFPTMVWFEDAKQTEYDGGRTTETIVDWVNSMTGAAVTETQSPPEPASDKPRVVLLAGSMLPGFVDAAKAMRRKADWYFVKQGSGLPKIMLMHKGEDIVELNSGCDNKDSVTAFVKENVLPLVGLLDGDSFDRYMEAGKGLIWSLFPNDGGFDTVRAQQRPMLTDVAKQVKANYFVTITDTDKFKEAIDNMLSVNKYPAIAVQKKAGDKKKFVFDGAMTADNIARFIRDVDADKVPPKLKSEPSPVPKDEPVETAVGSTLEGFLYRPDKDVLLEVYAPWCGHCKKLEPEYLKLANKIKKEGLNDLLAIVKIDGTLNDSPIDAVDWTGFPTIFFAKAGTKEATLYDGERTAKGLWKYIKKHATKAQEIRERIEKNKAKGKHNEL